MLKQLFSLLLCFVMLVSLFPSSFAESPEADLPPSEAAEETDSDVSLPDETEEEEPAEPEIGEPTGIQDGEAPDSELQNPEEPPSTQEDSEPESDDFTVTAESVGEDLSVPPAEEEDLYTAGEDRPAEEADGVSFPEYPVLVPDSPFNLSNDDLLTGYAAKRLGLDEADFTAMTAGDNGERVFSGPLLILYRENRIAIEEIAAGEVTSTSVSVSYETLYGTADISEDDFFSGEDLVRIVNCLLADCPYELYWFDKTEGFQAGYTGNSFVISYCVSADYSESGAAGTFEMSTEHAGRITAAVSNAQTVISSYAGDTTYEKLTAYKDYICEQVEYNHAAADNDETPYGDPWQLIDVFDGDPGTNVVCEGYSKAFQYLCDRSEFSPDAVCYSVSGSMSGGNHMWNIVRLEGGSYLCDITNIDAGHGDNLFMQGAPCSSGSYETRDMTYRFSSLSYTYGAGGNGGSDNMYSLFPENVLTLSLTDYGKTEDDEPEVTVIPPEYDFSSLCIDEIGKDSYQLSTVSADIKILLFGSVQCGWTRHYTDCAQSFTATYPDATAEIYLLDISHNPETWDPEYGIPEEIIAAYAAENIGVHCATYRYEYNNIFWDTVDSNVSGSTGPVLMPAVIVLDDGNNPVYGAVQANGGLTPESLSSAISYVLDSVTVSFESNGGTPVPPQRIMSGKQPVAPEAPVKEDALFAGWYSDEDLTEEYLFDAPVTGNLTLYAKWENAVSISESRFPDRLFRAHVLSSLDLNGDGILSLSEVDSVTELDISGTEGQNGGIASLSGIGVFKNLQILNCSYNALTELDMSGNPELRELHCEWNSIESLSLENCVNLEYLALRESRITELNVSNCPKLTFLGVGESSLTDIDVSNNPELKRFFIWDTPLESLDVSHNEKLTVLTCSNCGLTDLDVSHCPELTHLNCSGNSISGLDLTGNIRLENLLCFDNPLTSLDFTNNPALNTLDCSNCRLSALDLSACLELEVLYCYHNRLPSLDLSGNGNLTEVGCGNQSVTGNLRIDEDGLYTVDFNEMIGAERIPYVRIESDGSYDSATGLYTSEAPISDLTYYFQTPCGSSGSNLYPELCVTMVLVNEDDTSAIGSVPDGLWAIVYYPDGSGVAPTKRILVEASAYFDNDNGLTLQSVDGSEAFQETPDRGAGSITVDIPSFPYTGAAIKPKIHLYDGTRLLDGKAYSVSYKNNTKAAQYTEAADRKGVVTPSAKLPQIVISLKGNYSGRKTIYFNIENVNIAAGTSDEIKLAGTGKMQSVSPKLYVNGKTLKIGTDYTVSLTSGDSAGTQTDRKGKYVKLTNAGDYELTLTGKGNYTGTLVVRATVTDRVVHMSKATVRVGGDLFWKAGGAVPTVTVTASLSGQKITETLTAERGWTGTLFHAFLTGHEKVGKASVTVEPTAKGEAYFTGRKTAAFSVKAVGKLGSVTGLVSAMDYTGAFLEQHGFAVFAGDKAKTPLTESADGGVTGDYVVTYSANRNAGTAKMTFTGINGYAGSKLSKSFKINRVSLGSKTFQNPDLVISVDSSPYYEKGGAKPSVRVSWKGTTLKSGKDYTVKYSNNTVATTESTAKLPTVTVTGKGNYSGTASAVFTIRPCPIRNVRITADDILYSGKANKYTTKVTLTDSGGKKLQAGKDYEKTLVYSLSDGTILTKSSPALEAGTRVMVTVSGKGNYTGTTTAVFRVIAAANNISKATFRIANQEYTGNAVTLADEDILCTIGKAKTKLILGRDYEVVSYSGNISKGTAKVTFRGIGNYGGTKTVSFKITSRNALRWWQTYLEG